VSINNEARSRVRQSFVKHLRFAASSTPAEIVIDSVSSSSFFGGQQTAFGALYQEARCVGLNVLIYPGASVPSETGNVNTGLAIGWRPMYSGNPPASIDDIMVSTKSAYVTDSLTVPVSFEISAGEFRKNMLTKWLHNDNTPDSDTCTHGKIYYAATGTNSSTCIWTWIVHSVWEYQSPVPLAQNLSASVPASRIFIQPKFTDEKEEKEDKSLDPPPGVGTARLESRNSKSHPFVDEEYHDVCVDCLPDNAAVRARTLLGPVLQSESLPPSRKSTSRNQV